MQFGKTLALVILLAGSAQANIAAETALPLPVAMPGEVSMTSLSGTKPDGPMRSIALACGILCLAGAAQQAFASRRPRAARVRVE